MARKSKGGFLVVLFIVIVLVTIVDMAMRIVGAQQGKPSSTLSNHLTMSAFNPITYPNPRELFEDNQSSAAALPFSPDCGK